MIATFSEETVIAGIASAIGEPARSRILYSLLDGHARTSTELAIVAEVSPSTASVHLNRLRSEGLIKVLLQGKHRYYSLAGKNVARTLESLSILAGSSGEKFVPNTPNRLRFARTCYDHLAGTVSVMLHDHFREKGWVINDPGDGEDAYDLSAKGIKAIEELGIDLEATRALRRRFAYGCIDWSERKPHIGGALGAALLDTAIKRKWLDRDLDSRILSVTNIGKRDLAKKFGIHA